MATPTPDNLHPLAVLGRGESLGGLQGYCTATFEQLQILLGRPDPEPGDKATVEWSFRCADGTTFHVYDWKTPSTPIGDYDWHIGGTSRALEAFERFTGLKTRPLVLC